MISERVPQDCSDGDVVTAGFQMLVDSFAQYHDLDSEGCATRPLQDFATSLSGRLAARTPAVVTEPSGGAVTLAAQPPAQKPVRTKMAKASTSQGASGKPTPKIRSSDSAQNSRRTAVDVEQRGPLPRPFAAAAATAQKGAARQSRGTADASGGADGYAAMGAALGEAEVDTTDPEACAQWAQYYREVAAYFEQQGGGQPHQAAPPAASAAQASRAWSCPRCSHSNVASEKFCKACGAAAAQATPLAAAAPPVTLPAAVTGAMAGPSWLSATATIASPLGAAPQPSAPWLGGYATGGLAGNLASRSAPWPYYGTAVPGLPLNLVPGLTPTIGLGTGLLPGGAPVSMLGVAPTQSHLPFAGGSALGAVAALDDELLVNLLMSWYLSGYHTGHYAARQGK